MTKEETEITEIVNWETKAWDTRDVRLLISVFHTDMENDYAYRCLNLLMDK